MTVDFHQDLDTKRVRLSCQLRDEFESFRDHEATGPRFLYCISNGVEPNSPDAGGLKLLEDTLQVPFAFGVTNVDVDLLAGKCRPQQTLLAMLEFVFREWQTRARAI